MQYLSTRGQTKPHTFSEAVEAGLAPDGGLFLPETLPSIADKLPAWSKLTYPQLAAVCIMPGIFSPRAAWAFPRSEWAFPRLADLVPRLNVEGLLVFDAQASDGGEFVEDNDAMSAMSVAGRQEGCGCGEARS